MYKTKTFRDPQAAAAWANKPENLGNRLISLVPEPGKPPTYALLYEDTSSTSSGPDRIKILKKRIETMMAYPPATKQRLDFPGSIIPYKVVPFARLHNSLRGLKAFKDFEAQYLANWIKDNLGPVGYQVMGRVHAKQEYGIDRVLVEVSTLPTSHHVNQTT